MQVTRLDGPLGFAISGVDLEHDLAPEVVARILDAWIEGGVLLFRGVGSERAQLALSRIFGELQPSALEDLNQADNPYLMALEYVPGTESARRKGCHLVNGVERAGFLGWHWDQSFMPTIVRGAVLRMVEPPAVAGETGFIDAIAAYERLSPAMKARIEGLEVVYEYNGPQERNRFGFPDVQLIPGRDIAGTPSDTTRYSFPPSVHPLVITQAETGRKVLKLSPMHASRILGLDSEESEALLHELADHLVDERFAYYHRWEKDDMVAWDNWRVIHSAPGIPLDCTRRAMRTTILGDYNRGRYLDPSLDRERIGARIAD